MYIAELALQILRDMRAHKIRSVLALLGIIWGTVSVVLLLALGEGFTRAGQKNMQGLTTGAIRAWPGTTSKPYQGQAPGQTLHIKVDDLIAMQRALTSIQRMSPLLYLGHNTNLQWRQQQTTGQIMGISADYATLSQLKFNAPSRFINAIDVNQQQKIIFLGAKLKQQLFKTADAVGQTILVYGIPFLVIGVQTKNSDDASFSWDDNAGFIPYTTAQAIGGNNDIDGFILSINNPALSDIFTKNMRSYLGWRFHFDPTDTNAVYFFDSAKYARFFLWFFRAIEIFLGFCGLLTLGVGGIGVANIMFLIISERTQEFGLRMAVGAKPGDILMQVLLETGLIVLLGGLMGFVIAGGVISLLQIVNLPSWLGKPLLSPLVVVVTVFILAVVGLMAGYFPARRAANMQPVEALSFG